MDNSFQIVYAYKEAPKINIGTGLTASVKFNKRLSLTFGLLPELAINDRASSQMSITSTSRTLKGRAHRRTSCRADRAKTAERVRLFISS